LSIDDTLTEVYRQAATTPDPGLCCVERRPLHLPELVIPEAMTAMDYGCGATMHLADMKPEQTVLYVGVGGGLEALQFAYFARRPGGVIAIDPVPEMRKAARRNLEAAAAVNPWFDPAFVEIRDGDARALPVPDDAVDLAAQNCLFNVFQSAEDGGDLERALGEMHRVLKPRGRLVMSDPITPRPMPERLKQDEVLRARCLSGCQTLGVYLSRIVDAGFGTLEVRSRVPYRMLSRERYGLETDLLLESIEVAADKVPIPADGPCIFTGRTAVYTGPGDVFDDGNGHLLPRDVPVGVCDKTAAALAGLGRADLVTTPSTWHYQGGGCC